MQSHIGEVGPHRLRLGGRVDPVVGTFQHDRGHDDPRPGRQPPLQRVEGRIVRRNPMGVTAQPGRRSQSLVADGGSDTASAWATGKRISTNASTDASRGVAR